ncbi:hypothetical protein PR202_ga15979 [Eleusine coracana subsp. coracana]|uniref:BHLH domain-containing protein n=1 Tax=Eleusine coracana subsp. coracana TaxID=191504 RepID=A0AAV5CLM7_ELECO|nr:hypothetical protein PR202_ga15979 [Eleusine coracana subsp. coracana]
MENNSSSRERRRPPCRGRRQRRSAASLGRKVRELRRLVPAAARSAPVPADRLLLRTADYIVRLRARVELLRAVSELISAHHGSTGHADGDNHDAPLAT